MSRGHFALMHVILGKWQFESSRELDLTLQCGDISRLTRGVIASAMKSSRERISAW